MVILPFLISVVFLCLCPHYTTHPLFSQSLHPTNEPKSAEFSYSAPGISQTAYAPHVWTHYKSECRSSPCRAVACSSNNSRRTPDLSGICPNRCSRPRCLRRMPPHPPHGTPPYDSPAPSNTEPMPKPRRRSVSLSRHSPRLRGQKETAL